MFIVLVAGIHGVGKTYYCQHYAAQYDIVYRSSGKIIKDFLSKKNSDLTILDKVVSSVERNQRIILAEIRKIKEKWPNQNFLLDGHFTLLSVRGDIEDIPIFFYKNIGINAVVLLERDTRELKSFYLSDDNVLSEKFMQKERNRAIKITSNLKIPLVCLSSPTEEQFNLEINKLFNAKDR